MSIFRKLKRKIKAHVARMAFFFMRIKSSKHSNPQASVRVRGLIRIGDSLLAVRHHKNSEYYSLPGGGVEAGETLEDGLVRELKEELGITPVIGDLFLVNQHFDTDKSVHSVEFIFEIKNADEYKTVDLSKTTHGHEIYELAFLSIEGNEKIRPFFLKEEIQKDREYSAASFLHTSIHS